jgi:hypothetical protein
MATVLGVRQTIPTNSIALIDVIANSAGQRGAITKVPMSTLDAVSPSWRNMAGVTEFQHFMHDQREPRVFHVYPPSANSGGQVDIIASEFITDVPVPSSAIPSGVTGDIAISDQWDLALCSYMLSRAYAKDAEFGGNAQLSAEYAATFATMIGQQLQTTRSISPKSPKE